MQIMAGLDKPTSGEIWFNNENVTGMKVQKRNCSMVYQQFINYPNYTVYENIASPLVITGVKTDEIKQRVGKVAELLKLSAMLNKKPDLNMGCHLTETSEEWNENLSHSDFMMCCDLMGKVMNIYR